MFSQSDFTPVLSEISRRLTLTSVPLVLGLAGPQGSGKSTLAKLLASWLDPLGVRTLVLSLDDFYLRKRDRCHLAETVHPLLNTRGCPGTHDIDKLMDTIAKLTSKNLAVIEWPVFDKARDDVSCLEVNKCVIAQEKAQPMLVILEGWCVGCVPLVDLQSPVNALEALEDPNCVWRRYIDKCIRDKYTRCWDVIDMFMYINIPDISYILKWRGEQSVKNGEDPVKLDLPRFISFFDRVTRQMMNPKGRIATDFVVNVNTEHAVVSVDQVR